MTDIWKKLIRRLDALDGIVDGNYDGQPLTLAQQCGNWEELVHLGIDNGRVPPRMRTEDGRTVFIKCDATSKKLLTLVGIAEKMPFFKIIPLAAKHNFPIPQNQRANMAIRENMLGYCYISEMISGLVFGNKDPKLPLSELFETVSFVNFSNAVKDLALSYPEFHPETKAGQSDVYDSEAGFKILEYLGRKFRFNPKPFKPAKLGPPPKNPPPMERPPKVTATA